MSVIYLIRHGQASFGQQNYDQLSPLGHQQANLLGQSLASRVGTFDKVVLGSMLRHKQTLDNCLPAMGQSVTIEDQQIDSGWNEYDHHDILAQLGPDFCDAQSIETWVRAQPNPKSAFETLFNQAMNRWMSGKHDHEYLESWHDYQARIKTALQNVISTSSDANTIGVFTSGGPISVISQHLLGVDANKVMHVNWTLVNCSLTKIVTTKNRTFVSTLNDHSHFEGKHKSLITYK
ncbi:histidine phosphatase family protein [Aliiglaciecola litoralis]|uniref:Histidine phosphatase family protein n=1 Tax=Aliiglaciecola litoralis TaxID=582857 RepID=A0ABN1LH42_9ALTE